MELDKLREFIEFMDENNLCELEIEEEGKRIRLKKFSEVQMPIVQQTTQPQPVVETKQEKKTTGTEIKSPMVGTFYRASSPSAKPYVEVGDIIKPGDVVCIIEAMKLMNEIRSEIGGKIVQVLVENGEAVEFGQGLFLVEPL